MAAIAAVESRPSLGLQLNLLRTRLQGSNDKVLQLRRLNHEQDIAGACLFSIVLLAVGHLWLINPPNRILVALT